MSSEFTPEHLDWYQKLLEKFPGDKVFRSATQTTIQCTNPMHDDHNPSMGADLCMNGKGPKLNLYCRSGESCDLHSMLVPTGLDVDDLYFYPEERNGRSRARTAELDVDEPGVQELVDEGDEGLPGCTIEEYASAKHLDVKFLVEEVGLEQVKYPKHPGSSGAEMVDAILIPYPDEDGHFDPDTSYKRYRVAVGGSGEKVRGKKGMTPELYGRHVLEEAREKGYVYIVEGESDCHVFWQHGEPAVGVPGANNFKARWASMFDGIADLRFICEPDQGGEKLWSDLVGCDALRGRLLKVVLG